MPTFIWYTSNVFSRTVHEYGIKRATGNGTNFSLKLLRCKTSCSLVKRGKKHVYALWTHKNSLHHVKMSRGLEVDAWIKKKICTWSRFREAIHCERKNIVRLWYILSTHSFVHTPFSFLDMCSFRTTSIRSFSSLSFMKFNGLYFMWRRFTDFLATIEKESERFITSTMKWQWLVPGWRIANSERNYRLQGRRESAIHLTSTSTGLCLENTADGKSMPESSSPNQSTTVL